MPPKPARPALEVVVATLAPYLGENMARAAVKGHFGKLGLSAALQGNDLDRLLDALGPGLSVFVGRERMKEIAAAIREAVLANGASA